MATQARVRIPKPPEPVRARPPGHRKPPAQLAPGNSALIRLQQSLGNGAVARLLRKGTSQPAAHDSLLAEAHKEMESGAKLALECVPLAGEMHASSMATPGPAGPAASPIVGVLLQRLAAAGTVIDHGIQLFETAGGQLAAIEHLVRLRARVSAALWWLAQVQAGRSEAGLMAFQQMQGFATEWSAYQASEAVAPPPAGPESEEAASAAAAKGQVLRPLLGPLGAAALIT